MRSEGARRTERWREERHANIVHAGRDRRARQSRTARHEAKAIESCGQLVGQLFTRSASARVLLLEFVIAPQIASDPPQAIKWEEVELGCECNVYM